MSLKAFHIVFVAASVLVCFVFGAWLVHGYQHGESRGYLWGAVGSFAAGVGMIAYGRYVLRKLRHISYL
jgi:hypothetical protein